MQNLPRVVLLLESSRGSGRALLRGIANYARHRGPWAFLWEPHGLDEVWPRLDELAPDGFILRDVDQIDKVLALGLPTVVVGHRSEVPGVVNVSTNCEEAGRLAAQHLLGCGFQNFAFCGISNTAWSDQRGMSFQAYLQSVNHTVDFFHSNLHAKTVASWARQQRLMAEWLQSLPKPVGVLACNDDHAQKVIEACKMAGLNVPDEVGVVGADNDELVCELFGCPISSVVINFERAGYEAAQVLDEWMRTRKMPSKTRIVAGASHVVARQSTNTLAVKDPKVAAALRYITEHAKEDFGVLKVAQAAGLSRRALEQRFRNVRSRSILQEIRRIRVSLIARMLVETDLPVSRIAEAQGYQSVQHIARYFRQEKGMSPAAFRKKYQTGNSRF